MIVLRGYHSRFSLPITTLEEGIPALHADDTSFCWNLVCIFHSKPRITRINKVIIRATSIVNFNSTLMFIESSRLDKIISPICIYRFTFTPLSPLQLYSHNIIHH